jgi:hypothetical protein
VVVADQCPANASICRDALTREVCGATPAGLRWQDVPCAAGQGCVQGACVAAACADECNLGDMDNGATCAEYDVTTAAWSDPAPAASMHDRARAFEEWLRRDGMAAGGVGDARYADPPAYTQITSMDDIGDSAIWTGTYLAAEALRLKTTGSSDARARVKQLVDTLHLFFRVSGDPGVLARFAAPHGKVFPFAIGDLDCTAARTHCGIPYAGATWDYVGDISRDQYQGVLLGYALAYEALGEADEASRALIRDDVVAFVQELMKDRTVPLTITFNGTALPQTTVSLRFVVLASREEVQGGIGLSIDTSNLSGSKTTGFQEFTPDLSDVVHQIPGMSWVPTIPRASSAIMLASFFRVGLLVTDGIPASQATHDAILDYYQNHAGTGGNVNDWLGVAKTYSDLSSCGSGYFGNNISMEPMYNLARLEDDPTLSWTIRHDVLATMMWPLFRSTKNSFFSYIYAANAPGTPEAGAISTANAQLAQFGPPPRIRVPVDLRNDPRYMPHQTACTDQVDHTMAVDVADRPVADFLWQRDPWSLYDPGDLAQSEPGVDYLVAYWMARHHDFLADDTAGRCLRWKR